MGLLKKLCKLHTQPKVLLGESCIEQLGNNWFRAYLTLALDDFNFHMAFPPDLQPLQI